jgi:hypothetical protein
MTSDILASGARRVGGDGVRNADRRAPSSKRGLHQSDPPPDPRTETLPDDANGGERVENAAGIAASRQLSETPGQGKPPAYTEAMQEPSRLSIAVTTDTPFSGEFGERHAVLLAEFAMHHRISEVRVRRLVLVRAGQVLASDFADFQQDQFDRAEADAAHASDGWA